MLQNRYQLKSTNNSKEAHGAESRKLFWLAQISIQVRDQLQKTTKYTNILILVDAWSIWQCGFTGIYDLHEEFPDASWRRNYYSVGELKITFASTCNPACKEFIYVIFNLNIFGNSFFCEILIFGIFFFLIVIFWISFLVACWKREFLSRCLVPCAQNSISHFDF